MKERNGSLNITNKPTLYLDARMWLLNYADIAGDHSPMEMVTLLPQGRKSCYYCMYRNNRQTLRQQFASLQTFLEVWRHELPWLKIAKSLCKFIHCLVCDYLKDLIDRCPRSSVEYMHALAWPNVWASISPTRARSDSRKTR